MSNLCNAKERMLRMYKVEKTLAPNGKNSYLVIDSDYKIVEEILLFVKHLENKDFSINTIEKYCWNLKEYFNWLNERKLSFDSIEPRNIIDFISYLDVKKDNPSAHTINNYLSSISSFYEFYEVMGGFISKNPITKKKNESSNFIVKKIYKSQVETSYFKRKTKKSNRAKRLNQNDINTLYNAIPTLSKDADITKRNQLLFRLLYESGIRIGECLGLRLLDYSEPNPSEEFGELYVTKREDVYHKDHSVKTNSRIIPISMDLIYAIDEYVCDCRPQKDKMDTIFVNHGNNNAGLFMKRSTIVRFFNDLSKVTGIHCTAHMLRHTHATELAEFGYEQVYISNRLGHNSIESTNVYVHPSLESQTNAYMRFMNARKDDSNE